MRYHHIVAYRIIPGETFKIIRGCPGCGCKQTFSCKDRFRVNANGNRLDVWLIYGCGKCGHTYNLPVYERISPSKISEREYSRFLSNDQQEVFAIGTNKAVFIKNKIEIAWNLCAYEIVPAIDNQPNLQNVHYLENEDIQIKLYNPFDVPVRTDKIVANLLQITRNAAKRLLWNGHVSVLLIRTERK